MHISHALCIYRSILRIYRSILRIYPRDTPYMHAILGDANEPKAVKIVSQINNLNNTCFSRPNHFYNRYSNFSKVQANVAIYIFSGNRLSMAIHLCTDI